MGRHVGSCPAGSSRAAGEFGANKKTSRLLSDGSRDIGLLARSGSGSFPAQSRIRASVDIACSRGARDNNKSLQC